MRRNNGCRESGRLKLRTTSIKTIYLTQDELKDAIINWLNNEHHYDLGIQLKDNCASIEFCGPHDDLQISIDGEVEDRD